MEQLNFWLLMLTGSFGLIAMCLVMLGQPVRPVMHLVKATSFWFVVTWLALATILGALWLA